MLVVSGFIRTVWQRAAVEKSSPFYLVQLHDELAKSTDKDFIIIEGATHSQMPCVRCEVTPGQCSNATKNFFDYAATWINKRF